MKYIFDFDDVLFNNSKGFKSKMYSVLQEAGISKDDAYQYYQTVRQNKFSLKNFIHDLLEKNKKDTRLTDELYEKIMSECPNLTNTQLLEKIDKLGRDNCFIVSNGELKFQKEKIDRANISDYFKEIFIVPGSKMDAVHDICSRFTDEDIIFVDDKAKFFEDLDFVKYPNLKTVLYSM